MNVHVVFLLVRVVVILAHCTPHRVAQVVRVSHVIHACSERHSSILSSLFHPTSSSLYSLSICSSSCCPSRSTRIRSNTVFSANKEMGSTDESYTTHVPPVGFSSISERPTFLISWFLMMLVLDFPICARFTLAI